MTDVYETIYRIFNHISNFKQPPGGRRPLASVAFHRSEDFTTGSLREETMRIWRDLPIGKVFGINYLDWMGLPPDVVEDMVMITKEGQEKEARAAKEAEQALKNAQKDQLQAKADMLKNRRF